MYVVDFFCSVLHHAHICARESLLKQLLTIDSVTETERKKFVTFFSIANFHSAMLINGAYISGEKKTIIRLLNFIQSQFNTANENDWLALQLNMECWSLPFSLVPVEKYYMAGMCNMRSIWFTDDIWLIANNNVLAQMKRTHTHTHMVSLTNIQMYQFEGTNMTILYCIIRKKMIHTASILYVYDCPHSFDCKHRKSIE